MRRNTLNRIVALERSLAPGLDPIDRVILQVRAGVSDGDLRIYAGLEALAESERTQSEQAVFARCEQAYIDAFSVWTSDELRQIVATADSSRVFPSQPWTWTRATAGPRATRKGNIDP
jgi:hypothetical protein